jgi:hypothetical protein
MTCSNSLKINKWLNGVLLDSKNGVLKLYTFPISLKKINYLAVDLISASRRDAANFSKRYVDISFNILCGRNLLFGLLRFFAGFKRDFLIFLCFFSCFRRFFESLFFMFLNYRVFCDIISTHFLKSSSRLVESSSHLEGSRSQFAECSRCFSSF